MEVFINGLNSISPQDTFGESSLTEMVREYDNVRFLKCIEPKYSDFIDPMASRRMSRIVKMGLASALCCLKSSGVDNPGAIITGTGLGCIEDTTKFLASMYENEEKLLNPTPFIQSTHNTVSSAIAQIIKCNNYNNTYCDTGLAFENALLDAVMLINERAADNILLGAIDELTPSLFSITERLGFWKRNPVNSLKLLSDLSKGTIAGEGVSFFLLGNQRNENSYCRIAGLKTMFTGNNLITAELSEKMIRDLQFEEGPEIDLTLMGLNGDPEQDKIYNQLLETVFRNSRAACYKHLSGEYQTSVAFALYLAARIIKEQKVPAAMSLNNGSEREIKNILIYNHVRSASHSAILITKC